MANPVAVIGALVMIGNHWQSLGIIGKHLEITLRCMNSLYVTIHLDLIDSHFKMLR